MFKHDCQSLRDFGYKSCIPYYILFDPDLNQQHLKLYTLIEQMESNPNPTVKPTFSYAWFSSILGITPRAAMKIAKTMKDKNYISHTQKSTGFWIWSIVKTPVIESVDFTPETQAGKGESSGQGGVPQQDTGGVPQQDTQNTIKNKNKHTKTLVDFKKSPDYKADDLFMMFYKSYPNKQKPEVARKALYKHKPTPQFVSMLCQDVEKRLRNNWKGRHISKIPHPATYLNSKEWEGEIHTAEEKQLSTYTKPKYRTMNQILGESL